MSNLRFKLLKNSQARKLIYILFIFCLLFANQSFAFSTKSKHLLEKYCFDCHSDGIDKGDFEFEELLSKPLKSKNTKREWQKIWSVIEEHQMPPTDKKKQPSQAEREIIMTALEENVFSIHRKKRYAAPMNLVRLSNEQYAKTIKYLTGSSLHVSAQLPLDPTSAGFSNIGETLNISNVLFEQYSSIAQQISKSMFVEDKKDMGAFRKGSTMLKAIGDINDQEKVEKTLLSFTEEAYRRPLKNGEKLEIKELYSNLLEHLSPREAIMKSIQSILVSPNFIFRTELLGEGTVEGDLVKLNEYALASRLSYFLWNLPPDATLKKLASKGELRNQLKPQIKRLIKHKNFSNMARSFGQYWLGIQNVDSNRPNKQVFKKFNIELLPKMSNETIHFLKYLFQENRPLDDMFSSNITFLSKSLASYYQVPYQGKSKGYVKTEMPESHHRRGILSQPSVLIVTSDPDRTSPVKRGIWILETLLGMPPPPAPENIDPLEEPTPEEKNLTFRQQLEKHRSNKACASCHAMMDPIGFAMDSFDALGNWRNNDHGQPLDTKTIWRGHRINGFDDLYHLIITDYRDEFISCFSKKLLTYALGRGLEIEDRITTQKIVRMMNSKESSFQDLIIALIESTPFQYRTVEKRT